MGGEVIKMHKKFGQLKKVRQKCALYEFGEINLLDNRGYHKDSFSGFFLLN